MVETLEITDLKRAEKIRDLVESARQKSIEARADLDAAIDLCGQDTYYGVSHFDKKDLQDIESVIRVAVTRPLTTLVARWWDIFYGRQEVIRANKQ
jgi:hypothetical protein